MAHSHDRTLIARLGFSDPDKKDSLHDFACQYVVQPEIAKSIANVLREEVSRKVENNPALTVAIDDCWHVCKSCRTVLKAGRDRRSEETHSIKCEAYKTDWVFTRGQLEYPLKEKAAAGFIDARLVFDSNPHSGVSCLNDYCSSGIYQTEWIARKQYKVWIHERKSAENIYCEEKRQIFWARNSVFVEVKVHPVSAGDIIRQINFYRGFKEGYWVLVAVFPITPDLEQVLREADITAIQLGQGFQDFVLQQRTLRLTPSTAKVI